MAGSRQDLWSVDLERQVRDALRSIRYGSVTLVVQDGYVIQIDKSEKIRLRRAGHMDGSGI